MNRLIKIFILCFIMLVSIMFSACENHNYSEIEEYCYRINSIVKDIEFHSAKILEGKIALYDSKNLQINEISFNNYDPNKKIIAIRREGDAIYYIISGSVDDEQGIVFINNDSNSVLDGIKYLKRIGGNSYIYSTSE